MDAIRTLVGTLRELSVYPRLITSVYPLVRRELAGWTRAAKAIPDAELRAQALSSIEKKKFHCVGGAVLALGDRARMPELVGAIVAIQTISDYLDNLCDRSAVAAKWYAGAGGPPAGSAAYGPCGASAGEVPADRVAASAQEGFAALMRLHEALMCAVDPERPPVDYYDLFLAGSTQRPASGNAQGPASAGKVAASPDGGYLESLVSASRDVLRTLPGYCNGPAKSIASYLTCLYSELQSFKHLPPQVRDAWMERWYRARYVQGRTGCMGSLQQAGLAQPSGLGSAKWLGRDLEWWEFGAATGSTLGIFALICGSDRGPSRRRRERRPLRLASHAYHEENASTGVSLASAYFPAICGLHILLDYYIDQGEDLAGGDLNFVSHYRSPAAAVSALEGFTRWAMASADACQQDKWLHRAAVRGLLAMYLSDPKVARLESMAQGSQVLTSAAGGPTGLLKRSCAWLRGTLSF